MRDVVVASRPCLDQIVAAGMIARREGAQALAPLRGAGPQGRRVARRVEVGEVSSFRGRARTAWLLEGATGPAAERVRPVDRGEGLAWCTAVVERWGAEGLSPEEADLLLAGIEEATEGLRRARAADLRAALVLLERGASRERAQHLLRPEAPEPRAGQICSRPLLTIEGGRPLSEALRLMNRYGLERLLIAGQPRALTLRTVRYACRLGLGRRPVDPYAEDLPRLGPHQPVRPEDLRGGAAIVVCNGRPEGLVRPFDLRKERPLEGIREVLEEQPVLRAAREACERLGVRAYAVGGYLRDLLLGRHAEDVDIAVEGPPREFTAELARRLGATPTRPTPFGTLKLRLPQGGEVDVATCRAEHYVRPGALPRVRPAPLGMDLRRRDFAVNAMAARLDPEGFGRLVDPYGGWDDLRAGLLRALHPLSFVEDPSRALRGVRLEAALGFRLEERTLTWLQEAVAVGAFERPTGRLLTELQRCLTEPCLQRLEELGLLRAMGLRRARGLEGVPEELRLPMMVEDGRWMPLLNLGQRRAVEGRRRAAEAVAELQGRKWLPSQMDARLREIPEEALWLTGERMVEEYLRRFRRVRPLIGGEDLQRLGGRPGPEFSRVLARLRELRMDGRVGDREEELAAARAMLQGVRT